MPKSKEYISDSESGDEVPKKKAKSAKAKAVSKPSSDSSKNDQDSNSFPLGKKKFATVNEFKGSKYVNIREYYESEDGLKPGKKGIALTVEQWNKLKETTESIDKALEEL